MENHKHLLLDKRFWPTFWTQFFGAFNDNVYKNALVMLITYKSFKVGTLTPESMVALCGGIFILPFFLFSAIAGQVCDKYPKHKLMFYIKIWEILVMFIGAYGFVFQNLTVLLVTLFFMGLQSTFFGPVKYSILPNIIKEEELVQGNALVEMGTFVAILLGTIVGGVLIALDQFASEAVAIAVIFFALIGTFFSKGVLVVKSSSPNLKINYGLFSPIKEILQITAKNKSVFQAVLGISWFWFLGAALLSMFPGYVKNVIGGNEHVVTLFLALFSIGVAVGSIICERLSKDRLELGLVPFGTIGMSLFIFDLFLVGTPSRISTSEIGVYAFIKHPVYLRIMVDLLGLSIFSGFFTVPLYTFVQSGSDDSNRSRVIAGLNILNALFMVCSAVILTLFYLIGLSMAEIFGIWAILNLFVSLYIYTVIPEFLLRFLCVLLSRLSYRLKVKGHSNIPDKGGALLTCNHVSFIDWFILFASIKRPIRFVMYYKFMDIPFMKFLFKDAKVIPIAGKNENEELLLSAMKTIERELAAGELVCIFPEGSITRDGKLSGFRPGIERILEKSDVAVIPMTVKGLWGSFFSRKYNAKAMSKPSLIFKRWFSKVEVEIYGPWKKEDVTALKLETYTRNKLNE